MKFKKTFAVLAASLLLGGATVFIIANTIRLTVFARRREIAIMKYVGATDGFIRWPFVLEGVVLGFIGGLISAIVLRSFYAGVASKVYDTLAFFPCAAVRIITPTPLGRMLCTKRCKRFASSLSSIRDETCTFSEKGRSTIKCPAIESCPVSVGPLLE